MRRVHRGALLALCLAPLVAHSGPYADAGYDPSLMTAWASAVDGFQRGPMDIANPGLGDASYGVPEDALGMATGDAFDVCSLGDGGSVTYRFASGIEDGPGDDFAVYENGFFSVGGLFAEFAFVEVSSNGFDFARFESVSLQATPVSGGETVDPTDYGNFAGDQALGLGTGFDLSELAAHPLVMAGALDLSQVTRVRLIDVIGDGSLLDSLGQPVYDPYATPFSTSGFDVHAVGVLHTLPEPGVGAALAAGTGLLLRLRRCRRSPSCRTRSG